MAEERKNYNVGHMLGLDIDDLEVCQDLKLSPDLAYTPEINRAATEAIYQRNIVDGVRSGLSEKEAINQAKKARSDTHKLWTTLSKDKYI